jgi:hypothetical protein
MPGGNPLANSKWRVTNLTHIPHNGNSLPEKIAIKEMLKEEIKSVEVHFTKDSMFIINEGNVEDRGEMKKVTSTEIYMKKASETGIIKYELSNNQNELNLTLPNGTKLFMERI